jgi:hypothetical protein
MALTGQVRVGELVHQRQLRAPVEHRLDVQFREAGAPVGDRTCRDHFEIAELGSGRRSAVPLPVGHGGIGAGASPGACVPQHAVGLPDSGGNPQVGAQRAPAGRRVLLMGTSPGDQVRVVLGPGAAGHRWIHSDRVVRVRPPDRRAAAGTHET